MSKLFATAGARVYIGAAPKVWGGQLDLSIADFPSNGGNAIDWIKISGVTNFGRFGDVSEVVLSPHIETRRARKLKGVRNAGAMQIVADIDYEDPGQLALIAAEKYDYSFPFKVVFKDAPVGGTPSERYFIALVMSADEALDEANNTMRLNAALEIDSNIVRVAATASGVLPDNTILPVITGTAAEDEVLTVAPGTWTGTPAPTLTYQWFAGGESIPGAPGTTYQVQAGDVGKTITVLETATNSLGSAQAMSAPTATVTS